MSKVKEEDFDYKHIDYKHIVDTLDHVLKRIEELETKLKEIEETFETSLKYLVKHGIESRDKLIRDYLQASQDYENEIKKPEQIVNSVSLNPYNHPELKYKKKMDTLWKVYSMIYDDTITEAITRFYIKENSDKKERK
jgi:hypothetical protein